MGWSSPDTLNDSSDSELQYLVTHRDHIEVIGGWSDDQCEYEYHEIALVRLDNDSTSEVQYYALTTSGCSCPSPNETWIIDFGPATCDELLEWCRKASDRNREHLCSLLTDEHLLKG